jgi:predicted secreted protein
MRGRWRHPYDRVVFRPRRRAADALARAAGAARAITLAEGDAGRVVVAARGQTIDIRLSGRRSPDYCWALLPACGGVLAPVRTPLHSPLDAPAGGVPGGAVETWTFVASRRGRQELRFEYRRPREATTAPAHALTYTITVC